MTQKSGSNGFSDSVDHYLLSSRTYLCIHNGRLVIADLHSGRYLVTEYPGVSDTSLPSCRVDLNRLDPNILGRMVCRQLLTRDRRRGRIPTVEHLQLPQKTLRDVYIKPRDIRITLLTIIQFVLAVWVAKTSTVLVKRGIVTMRTVINRHINRKTRARVRGTSDEARLRYFLAVFDKLRPFAFRRVDTCLLYCLSFLEFAAYNRISLELVFGVRTDPFRAHCWIQWNEYALSCSAFDAGGYTPILRV